MRKAAVIASAVLCFCASAQEQTPDQSRASRAGLAETLDWIRERLTTETRPAGIRVKTEFGAEGCKVSFVKTSDAIPRVSKEPLPLLVGVSLLNEIAYIDVVDEPVGVQWMGTSLVFRTANGQARLSVSDLDLKAGRLVDRTASSFKWHLGSVPATVSTAENRQVATRLRAAFVHAVELCGGSIKKEPF